MCLYMETSIDRFRRPGRRIVRRSSPCRIRDRTWDSIGNRRRNTLQSRGGPYIREVTPTTISISGGLLAAMTWREYHEATKHSVESLRRARQVLDWANMPDPFRHYEGVPVLDLPADPPAPETPSLEVLQGALGGTSAADGATFLSQLL